jgi:hypothetical protein
LGFAKETPSVSFPGLPEGVLSKIETKLTNGPISKTMYHPVRFPPRKLLSTSFSPSIPYPNLPIDDLIVSVTSTPYGKDCAFVDRSVDTKDYALPSQSMHINQSFWLISFICKHNLFNKNLDHAKQQRSATGTNDSIVSLFGANKHQVH